VTGKKNARHEGAGQIFHQKESWSSDVESEINRLGGDIGIEAHVVCLYKV